MTQERSSTGWRQHLNALRRGDVTCEMLTAITLFSCLFLQRFAVPTGGGPKISLATPVVLGATLLALLSGHLVVERRRFALYLGLVAVALFSTAVAMNLQLAIAPRISNTSLLYWLAITGFAVFRFRRPMAERAFFGLVSDFLLVVAVAGILQFLLQFVGLRLFTFTGLVPDSFLIEEQYAVVIPMDAGFRSNGFFTVEPSVFSQFMALAIAIEVQQHRRIRRIGVLFAGLLMSASGTGYLILAAFVAVLAVGAGRRGFIGAVVIGIAGVLAFIALSFALPSVAGMMTSRMDEFGMQGTSGNERFVTPFMALDAVWKFAPWTPLTGIGPGAAEQIAVPFFYRMNAPVKILLEYGFGGLFFYLAVLIAGRRTASQLILLLPCLVLLLLTGGYQQFSPVLFLIVLICDVAYLEPSRAAPGRRVQAGTQLLHA